MKTARYQDIQEQEMLCEDDASNFKLHFSIGRQSRLTDVVIVFTAPAAIQSLPIRTSALARSEPHKKEEQEEPLTQSEGKVGGKSASFSMSEAAIDGHPGDIKGMVKQVIVTPIEDNAVTLRLWYLMMKPLLLCGAIFALKPIISNWKGFEATVKGMT